MENKIDGSFFHIGYTGEYTIDKKGSIYSGKVVNMPNIPEDVLSFQGKTEKEAEDNFKLAVQRGLDYVLNLLNNLK